MNFYCPSGVLNALSAAYYRVPVQRRRFCWSQRQITQLIEDIVRTGLQPSTENGCSWHDSHFLGTILVANDSSNWVGSRKAVVDGQQRLTTIMLVMICLVRQIRERHGGILPDSQGNQLATADRLFWMYVREDRLGGDKLYRLELPGADGRALKAIIDESGMKEADASHLYEAYELILNYVASLKSLDFLLHGLMRLELAAINLPSRENADSVFRTVNAKADYT